MSTGTGGAGEASIGKNWDKWGYRAFIGIVLLAVGSIFYASIDSSNKYKKMVEHNDWHKRELTDYFAGADSVLSNVEEFKMKEFMGLEDSASTYQITQREYLAAYWKMLDEQGLVEKSKHPLVLRKETGEFYKNLEHLKFVRSQKNL